MASAGLSCAGGRSSLTIVCWNWTTRGAGDVIVEAFFCWLTYAEFGTRYRLLLDSGYEVVDVISQEDVVL